MNPDLFEQVRGIAADLFAVDANELTRESSPETVAVWDSTLHLSLVLAFEERFNVQLSPQEIDQIHNLGDAVRVLGTRLHAIKGQ